MNTEKDIFKEYLREKELKFTPERDAILEEVFEKHEHFDVEKLYQRLNSKGKHISRATIYRTIPILIDSGLIGEAMKHKNRIYYEHTYGHKPHEHMVCTNCGKIIEFNDKRVKKIIEEITKDHDFKSNEYKFEIKGFCKGCQ